MNSENATLAPLRPSESSLLPWSECDEAASPIEADLLARLMNTRCNVSGRRLVAPGPSPKQVQRILGAAASAPDHGLLRPWRFVEVPPHRRAALGKAFELALLDRDGSATVEQMAAARDKAQRAPFLMLAIARLGTDGTSGVPDIEKMVSVGAAIQNILLMAHAMGFGAGLASGRSMQSPRLADLFQLLPGERAVCFINIGSIAKHKPVRDRPPVDSFFSAL